MEAAISRPLIEGQIGCRRYKMSRDKTGIVDLMTNQFCLNEPLGAAVNKVYCPNKRSDFIINRLFNESFGKESSLVAYNVQSEEIVAVMFCNVDQVSEKKGSMDKQKIQENLRQIGSSFIILKLIDKLRENLLEITGRSQYLCISMISTKSTYERRGITTGLMKRIELVAEDMKCKFIVGDFTSLYTQRIASKLGYTTVNEIKYDEYLDPVTESFIFKAVSPPHESVKLMIKRLD